jgi:hypothetical protein
MEWGWETWSRILEVVIAVSIIVTAFAAWKGLRAWKTKLEGENEYEAAKKVIEGLYEFEEAVKNARRAWVPTGKQKPSQDQAERDQELVRKMQQALAPGLEKAHSSLRLAKTHWPEKAKVDREALDEKLRELLRQLWITRTRKRDRRGPTRLL